MVNFETIFGATGGASAILMLEDCLDVGCVEIAPVLGDARTAVIRSDSAKRLQSLWVGILPPFQYFSGSFLVRVIPSLRRLSMSSWVFGSAFARPLSLKSWIFGMVTGNLRSVALDADTVACEPGRGVPILAWLTRLIGLEPSLLGRDARRMPWTLGRASNACFAGALRATRSDDASLRYMPMFAWRFWEVKTLACLARGCSVLEHEYSCSPSTTLMA